MRPIAVLLAGLLVSGASAAPRLHLSTPTLVPESSVELILDRAAVGENQIGKETENHWLEISPAWLGRLYWKEANVAEFRPASPPALGARYEFKVKKGLKHLDGSEVPDGPVANLQCQPFQVDYATILDRYAESWSPRQATFFLRFNDDVDPDKAAPFLFYRSAEGNQVAAKTERATFGRIKHPGYVGPSWTERFHRRGEKEAPPALTPEFELPNGLVVTPREALPLGKTWQLVLLRGLPASNGKATIPDDATRYIGDIEPLKVEKMDARSVADEPRRIVVDFNMRLQEEVPLSAVKIDPLPANLRIEVRRDELHLLGDFSGHTSWHVSVNSSIASYDGRALEKPFTADLKFKPVPAGLALPSQDESQLASGSRQYDILTVNLDSVRLRVKRLDPLQLVRAQQGYRHYTGIGHDGAEISPAQALPYELMGGETIADLQIPLTNAPDTSARLRVDWDKILEKAEDAVRVVGKDPEPGAAVVPRPPSAFFLEVTGVPKPAAKAKESPVAQALVQLTDIGLAWKAVDGQTLVLAYSCLTGKPLEGVKLTVFGEDAKLLRSVSTGGDGLATLPPDDGARHLQASKDDDVYGISFDSTLPNVSLWRFPVRYSWSGSPLEKRRVFLFTDRSLYRPGETVHIKGIVRHQKGNAIMASPPAPNRLVIEDPTGRQILSTSVEVTESGSFDHSFQLPEGKTGHHSIRFEYPEELEAMDATENWYEREAISMNARFHLPLRVEEFRRNAFEITHEPEAIRPGAEEVSLLLKAAYFHGQPVAKGKVETYTHIADTNFYPERFRDYLFGNHRRQDWNYWYHYFGYRWDDDHFTGRNEHIPGKGELASDGTFRVTAKLPQSDFPTTREVSITTEVTDANQQTLTRSTDRLMAHPSSVYVGIARIDRLVRAGDRVPIGIVAVTTGGASFEGDLEVEAILSREVNEQVRIADGNGGGAVRNETRREELSTTTLTLAGGKGTEFLFAPERPGLHEIELRGKDAEGHPFATVASIHVYGGSEYPWAYEDGMRIKLVPEKKIHRPGDTARVLVLSPIEGTALVTVEREKVLRSFLTELTTENPVIEIPVGDDDAPNAFVSVLVIKGAKDSARLHKEPQLRLGYCELTVENHRDRLAVAIEAPEDSVLPNQEITVSGSVLLADGKPAGGAEVTFYAEDEGTLAVMGYQTPDPMACFYDPRELRVRCGTSLDNFLPESPDRRSFYNKGFFIGGGDGDFDLGLDAVRRDFNPCAGWLPALRTGPDGKFSATLKLPDTLTRYRLIAVAHHGESRFGHGEGGLTVAKPLMVEPQAPRFANEGDRLDVRALVQNSTEHAGTWKITFMPNPASSDPIAVLAGGEESRTLSIEAGGSASVVFPVEFRNTGEAVFSWVAEPVSYAGGGLDQEKLRRLSDRVEARFQVHHPVPLLRQNKFVSLKAGKEINLLDGLDPTLIAGRGEITLQLSRSMLLDAAGSADFLLNYPYGCVEQTASSLIPWLAIESLRGSVPSLAKYPPEKVRSAITNGTGRLLSMQLAEGGFGYWPGATEEAEWTNAYVGLALILAEKAGADVPTSAISALCDRLERDLRGVPDEKTSVERLESACQALWVLALADRRPVAYVNKLRDRMSDLSPRARAFLALAANACNADGDPAAILRHKNSGQKDAKSWMPWDNHQAVSLLAWTTVAPGSREALAAFESLLRNRNPYGHWRTTWVNGWAMLAMAAWAEHENIADETQVTISGPDGPRTIQLKAGEPPIELSFPLTEGLSLKASSPHQSFVRINVASKPEIAPQQPVAKNGMEITRFYERIHPDGTSEPLDQPALGDLIRVTLEVELPDHETRYLVVEDRLPSIFEAVNNDFSSQAAHGNAGGTSEESWNVSHSELRSDRALFFYDRSWHSGRRRIVYIARCTMEGKAVAPPAKVESMYDPDNFALSASREF